LAVGSSLLALVACGGGSPPPAAPPVAAAETHDAAPVEAPPIATVTLDAPERSRPPSTLSYDEALSTPEALDVNDDRAHLTDAQLQGPMRGVLNGCRVPSNASVTIRTAVQNGRAIGVTVDVHFQHPKAKRGPPLAVMRAEAKASAKIVACVDRAVRQIVWPPSRRRDSFSMHF